MELKIKTYNEMPLRVFQKIDKLRTETKDVVDFEIELMALLCDCGIVTIMDLPIVEYRELLTQAQFIGSFPEVEESCPDRMSINGHNYVVTKDLTHINTAQYIDFQNYLKMENNTAYVLSCFLIPEGKKYMQGYKIDDVVNDILDLDVVSALGVCFFFINSYLLSIRTIVSYLVSQMKKEVRKEKDKEKKKKLKMVVKEMTSIINGVG